MVPGAVTNAMLLKLTVEEETHRAALGNLKLATTKKKNPQEFLTPIEQYANHSSTVLFSIASFVLMEPGFS